MKTGVLYLPFYLLLCNNFNFKNENIIGKGNVSISKTSSIKSKLIIEDDVLMDGWVTFATPNWGDGKNGDDSYLDIKVKFKTSDRKEYFGTASVRNNSEIAPGRQLQVPLQFSVPKEKLNFDNIAEIAPDYKYMKPNWSPNFPVNTDKWNARSEVVLKFKSGKIIASGATDPAWTVGFRDHWETWPVKSTSKSGFFSHATLIPPFK